MSRLDDSTRARIAAGWEPSGLGQAEYAKAVGIRPRTLRAWRALYQTEEHQGAPADDAITQALNTLLARLADVDREVDAARAAAAACKVLLHAAAPLEPALGGVTEVAELLMASPVSESLADAAEAAEAEAADAAASAAVDADAGGTGGTEHPVADEQVESCAAAACTPTSEADQPEGALPAIAPLDCLAGSGVPTCPDSPSPKARRLRFFGADWDE